jgi:hypothetical protein
MKPSRLRLASVKQTFPACSRLGALFCLVLSSQVGCIDLNGPDPLTQVSVAVESVTVLEVSREAPGIACGIWFAGTATGSDPKERTIWRDATARFYYGIERVTTDDTLVIAAGDVFTEWAGGFGPGERKTAGWAFSAFAPFTVEVDFTYVHPPDDEKAIPQHAVVRADCGPRVAPGTAGPTLEIVSFESDFAQPGSQIVVTFEASSAAGLWATGALLRGENDGPEECRSQTLRAAELVPTIRRSFALAVPAQCPLNRPVSVEVFAYDAALQGIVRGRDFNVVDASRPTMYFTAFPPDEDRPLPNQTLYGIFFAGDSLRFDFFIHDNVALQSLAWEALGTGASEVLPLQGKSFVQTHWIHVRPSWVGARGLRFVLTDAAGLQSTLESDSYFYVYPTVSHPILEGAVQGDVDDLVIDEKRQVLYLLQGGDRRIAVLSASTLAVQGTIALPTYASSMDLTPSGDSLLVALPEARAFAVIDLREASPSAQTVALGILDPTLVQEPKSVRTTANDRAFISVWGGGAANRLVEVNLLTGQQRFRDDAGNDGIVRDGLLARSGDFSRLFVNEGGILQAYEAQADLFGPRKQTPIGIAVSDYAGQHVAVAWRIFNRDLDPLADIESEYFTAFLGSFGPDGKFLYHGRRQSVMRTRSSDGELLDRFVSPFPVGLTRVNGDGSVLFAVERRPEIAPWGIIRLSAHALNVREGSSSR